MRQSKDLFLQSRETPKKDIEDEQVGPEIKTGNFLGLRPCSEFTPPRESYQLPRLTPPPTTFNPLVPRESHGGSSGDLVQVKVNYESREEDKKAGDQDVNPIEEESFVSMEL